MGSIRIISPGLLTMVQDNGRYGYQQYGVPVSGVMDNYSHRLGNILIGNDEFEAVLEATMVGPKVEFLDDMAIAITGGNLSPAINGRAVPLWETVLVHRGDLLEFGGLKTGCRCYIALSGGIDVPVVMGSKSTYTRANLGGYNGRVLKAGDIVKTGNPGQSIGLLNGRKIPAEHVPDYSDTCEVRVVPGPQDNHFTAEGMKTFLSEQYRVTNQCDRMGYRLQGRPIAHKKGSDIISDGIAMGAIQVTGDGQPIIMMADRQTTGGYTKIANVITADLPKVAQAKPGDIIKFVSVSIDRAQQLMREIESNISRIKQSLAIPNIISTRQFRITVNGRHYDVTVDEMAAAYWRNENAKSGESS
jgi:antagonist of KipI